MPPEKAYIFLMFGVLQKNLIKLVVVRIETGVQKWQWLKDEEGKPTKIEQRSKEGPRIEDGSEDLSEPTALG